MGGGEVILRMELGSGLLMKGGMVAAREALLLVCECILEQYGRDSRAVKRANGEENVEGFK